MILSETASSWLLACTGLQHAQPDGYANTALPRRKSSEASNGVAWGSVQLLARRTAVEETQGYEYLLRLPQPAPPPPPPVSSVIRACSLQPAACVLEGEIDANALEAML